MNGHDNRPIGVFDSGLGGLTVVKELVSLLPSENYIYLGDTARVPYGVRSAETIKSFSSEDTKFLLSKNVKAIVIACNTSSAIAYEYLKNKYKNVPIFEVIGPAATEAQKNGDKIGVIGTNATVGSLAYTKKISKYSKKAMVKEVACPLLVPFIEEGEVDGVALRAMVDKYIGNFKAKINVLIMGCTHYPIIENVIREKTGDNVQLINPGKSVAVEVSNYLKEKNLLNNQNKKGEIKFFVTDLTSRFTKVAEMFLGMKIKGRINKVSLIS